MPTVHVPTVSVFYDLYALSSISAGKSLIVTNGSSDFLFLTQSTLIPSPQDDFYPVAPGETVLIHGSEQTAWIKAGNGPVIVQEVISTITPFTGVDLPHDLYTSAEEGFRRLRVDSSQTGFFRGREFRTFKELNIEAGASYVIRASVNIPTILFNVNLTLDSGSLRLTTLVGGTPGGTFSENLPIIAKNLLPNRPTPLYLPQNLLAAGGTITGGTAIDIVRVVASQSTAQQTSVGSSPFTERGIAVGTYYWKLENIGSGAATGVFSGFWEERD